MRHRNPQETFNYPLPICLGEIKTRTGHLSLQAWCWWLGSLRWERCNFTKCWWSILVLTCLFVKDQGCERSRTKLNVVNHLQDCRKCTGKLKFEINLSMNTLETFVWFWYPITCLQFELVIISNLLTHYVMACIIYDKNQCHIVTLSTHGCHGVS